MYGYITKGFTVGQIVMRQLCRTLTGIPGAILDCLVALFWVPEYKSYWQECNVSFADGKRVGFFQGLSGWFGEITGYVLGATLGVVVGFACFIPDTLLKGIFSGYRRCCNGLDEFAMMLGRHSRFDGLGTHQPPVSYLQKAWNISVGTLGLGLAAPLYLTAKLVETFLPLGSRISNIAWKVGGYMGGVIGSVISLPLYPINKIVNNLIQLYENISKAVLFVVAFIYAKNNEEPIPSDHCCPLESIHSNQFRDKVNEIKNTTTATLFLGQKSEAVMIEDQDSSSFDDSMCPITKCKFEDPVIDRMGHTYERSAIMGWLNRGYKSCPLGTEPLKVEDLAPNRALKSLLQQQKS